MERQLRSCIFILAIKRENCGKLGGTWPSLRAYTGFPAVKYCDRGWGVGFNLAMLSTG
jgi:hypothetical protein